MNLKNTSLIDLDDVVDKLCDQNMLNRIDMRVNFMNELIELRDSQKISQADFNILVEGDDTIENIDDMLDFIFHMLAPLGKTISIVDKELAD